MSWPYPYDEWTRDASIPTRIARSVLPKAQIERAPAFTAEQAIGYAKRTWWVRDDSRSKPGRTVWACDPPGPATEPLRVVLSPGVYTIGAGPPEAYRERVEVDENGREVIEVAPCIITGCPETVRWSPRNPSCSAFALNPPPERRCEGHR